ncbi:hypothetical protein FXO38_10411 [Capsicum annuum]|nr:hypothetical protein FXO38_10411 [Capsicum annuum]
MPLLKRGKGSSKRRHRLTARAKPKDDVRFIGIYGAGGIGKTAIAKAIFNQIFQHFEGSCFLADIRVEASEKHAGLVTLQEELLCETLGSTNFIIDNVNSGVDLIKEKLCSKKVLIFLDDVNHECQLESLASARDCWHAFENPVSSRDYEEISKDIVAYIGGLPSALIAMGSSLFGKHKPVWRSTFEKLKAVSS